MMLHNGSPLCISAVQQKVSFSGMGTPAQQQPQSSSVVVLQNLPLDLAEDALLRLLAAVGAPTLEMKLARGKQLYQLGLLGEGGFQSQQSRCVARLRSPADAARASAMLHGRTHNFCRCLVANFSALADKRRPLLDVRLRGINDASDDESADEETEARSDDEEFEGLSESDDEYSDDDGGRSSKRTSNSRLKSKRPAKEK